MYLPEDLKARLDAEAAATGVSRAELIRRGIAMLLEDARRAGVRRGGGRWPSG
ncbi:ribbon-helix-helix protein, CopG family [Streptomyces sp. OF8]|uniref:Ribbon-helix-helix protein, CopG family n=1 Tax=Streptomyces alkaliterrae TaxID=2213162 RepID=A0A5P0YW89_9ACTN|nr:ribbon-helix-helix protein, CopG family [Streptomyces alkaliterrae]MQS04548.1 ribbon-helix-helix protein, CopG family [Streptomyces alkaliterrae]